MAFTGGEVNKGRELSKFKAGDGPPAEEQEANRRGDLHEPRAVLHFHEDQDDQQRLGDGHEHGDRQVEIAEVDARHEHRDHGEHHERGEDYVELRLRWNVGHVSNAEY